MTEQTTEHPKPWNIQFCERIHSVFVMCVCVDTVTSMCRFEWCCSVNSQISGIDVKGIILPKHLHAFIIWLDLAVNWLLIVQHQMQCIVSQSFPLCRLSRLSDDTTISFNTMPVTRERQCFGTATAARDISLNPIQARIYMRVIHMIWIIIAIVVSWNILPNRHASLSRSRCAIRSLGSNQRH